MAKSFWRKAPYIVKKTCAITGFFNINQFLDRTVLFVDFAFLLPSLPRTVVVFRVAFTFPRGLVTVVVRVVLEAL